MLKTPEKLLSALLLTDVYIFMLLYLKSDNARRDTAAEKESNIIIQMTLERVLV